MNYLWAFLIGGVLCAVGQLLIDLTKLTPARILTGDVVAGVVLSAVGLYAPLAEFAGAGASVPLLGFGHLLAKGVRTAVAEKGGYRHPDRRADRGLCGHHRKPCLRRGVQPCGQKPRPELNNRMRLRLAGKCCLYALLRYILRPAAGKLGAKRR